MAFRALENEGSVRLRIQKLLGSRQAEDEHDVMLGFRSTEGDVELSLDANMLMPLALEVLNSRTTWERGQARSANGDFHALIVERWELRRTTQKSDLLLSLKVAGGTWLRFEIPRDAIAAMQETIEVAEGRRPLSSPPKRKN